MFDLVISASRGPTSSGTVSYSWECPLCEATHYPNLDLLFMINVVQDHVEDFHKIKPGFYQIFTRERVLYPDWAARGEIVSDRRS
jgi:hypothetical protein